MAETGGPNSSLLQIEILLKNPGHVDSFFQVPFRNIWPCLKHAPSPTFWTRIWADFDVVLDGLDRGGPEAPSGKAPPVPISCAATLNHCAFLPQSCAQANSGPEIAEAPESLFAIFVFDRTADAQTQANNILRFFDPLTSSVGLFDKRRQK